MTSLEPYQKITSIGIASFWFVEDNVKLANPSGHEYTARRETEIFSLRTAHMVYILHVTTHNTVELLVKLVGDSSKLPENHSCRTLGIVSD
jgi:hypothetical protein